MVGSYSLPFFPDGGYSAIDIFFSHTYTKPITSPHKILEYSTHTFCRRMSIPLIRVFEVLLPTRPDRVSAQVADRRLIPSRADRASAPALRFVISLIVAIVGRDCLPVKNFQGKGRILAPSLIGRFHSYLLQHSEQRKSNTESYGIVGSADLPNIRLL